MKLKMKFADEYININVDCRQTMSGDVEYFSIKSDNGCDISNLLQETRVVQAIDKKVRQSEIIDVLDL